MSAPPQPLPAKLEPAPPQRAADPARPKDKWTFKVPYATITIVALLIVWQAATYVLSIPNYLLPPPSERRMVVGPQGWRMTSWPSRSRR